MNSCGVKVIKLIHVFPNGLYWICQQGGFRKEARGLWWNSALNGKVFNGLQRGKAT
jgi:hypothetical protein